MLNLKQRKGSHERRELGFIEIILKIRHVVDVRSTHKTTIVLALRRPLGSDSLHPRSVCALTP